MSRWQKSGFILAFYLGIFSTLSLSSPSVKRWPLEILCQDTRKDGDFIFTHPFFLRFQAFVSSECSRIAKIKGS